MNGSNRKIFSNSSESGKRNIVGMIFLTLGNFEIFLGLVNLTAVCDVFLFIFCKCFQT